jgi:hypothetical protein
MVAQQRPFGIGQRAALSISERWPAVPLLGSLKGGPRPSTRARGGLRVAPMLFSGVDLAVWSQAVRRSLSARYSSSSAASTTADNDVTVKGFERLARAITYRRSMRAMCKTTCSRSQSYTTNHGSPSSVCPPSNSNCGHFSHTSRIRSIWIRCSSSRLRFLGFAASRPPSY